MKMDESKRLYRNAAQTQSERIKHLEEHVPPDRTPEIAMLRASIEECLESGNLTTLNALTTTLDRLIKNHLKERVLQNRLIGVDRLKLWMMELANIIADEARARFPDGEWEEFLCSLSDKMALSFDSLSNSEAEVRQLKLPR